jgi:hypothetical protein
MFYFIIFKNNYSRKQHHKKKFFFFYPWRNLTVLTVVTTRLDAPYSNKTFIF